ncbi:MAG: glycosyltransferase family 2 protein [Nanoarchaeota archaeon]|nr:glycosyltransferase family 2 protein [Nanoarchaeota archaeon]
MKKGFVSIVIANYNGKHLLKAILDSIKKSHFRNYEIIIVDNNSNDGSQEFIKKNYKNAKLVANEKNLGYSGINSALKCCKGEYILFLNNDMELDRNCIGKLVESLQDKNAAMAAPRFINFYDKSLKSGGTWVSRAFYNGHIKSSNDKRIKEIPYLGVGLIKKKFVDVFGYLFDPYYFIYAEDLDLGIRIRMLGMKVLFVPEAVIYHIHSATMQKVSFAARNTFLLERNLLFTFFKDLELKNITLFLPYVLLMRFAAIVKDVFSFQLKVAMSRVKALLWILFNFNLVIKKRNEVQKLRKADDSYVLKAFSEKYLFKKKFVI